MNQFAYLDIGRFLLVDIVPVTDDFTPQVPQLLRAVCNNSTSVTSFTHIHSQNSNLSLGTTIGRFGI